jgi:hypothetical protein
MNYKLCGLLLLFYYFWLQSQLFLATDVIPNGTLVDRIHDSEIVNWITSYLENNKAMATFHLTLTTFLIDITIISVIGNSIWTHNLKVPLLFIGGIALRQVCQVINKLPAPHRMIWYDPQTIPTIFMVYETNNDLFFSGHTYTSMAMGLELFGWNNTWAKIYGIFFIVYQIAFVLVTRSHYFVDVYGAIATYFMLRYFWDRMIGEEKENEKQKHPEDLNILPEVMF